MAHATALKRARRKARRTVEAHRAAQRKAERILRAIEKRRVAVAVPPRVITNGGDDAS